jgi:hypothetical protein
MSNILDANQRSVRWSWPRNWTTTRSEENLEITKFKHFSLTTNVKRRLSMFNKLFDITYQLIIKLDKKIKMPFPKLLRRRRILKQKNMSENQVKYLTTYT